MVMKKTLVIAALVAASSGAWASSIFSDNFNGDTIAANTTPSGWSVGSGTVDVVGPGWFGNLCAATGGSCVDLDGSTNRAGTLSKSFSLLAGNTYTASFDLAGNQRGGSDVVDIAFGGSLSTLSLTSSAAWATYSLTFAPTTSGNYTLSFHNRGGDNVGAVLDNVNVSVAAAVPEPESYAMLLAGLGLMGVAARRRNKR